MSKGNAPTAVQKAWRETVRELGSVISGAPAVIHHPIGCGKNAKHNKVHIGHWWVIPLTDDEHKALHAGENFGHHSRKEFEKTAYNMIFQRLWKKGIPHNQCPSTDCHSAIMDYHR